MKAINISKEEIEILINEGKSVQEIADIFHCSRSFISRKVKSYGLKATKPTRLPLSDKVKANLSKKRSEWLQKNPDKHPWRSKEKFKSTPCEKAKEFLTSLGVLFVEEYPANIQDRHFSIDIALPDKMIALEINGNQHYERDGRLKPYYQEREDLLCKNGWQVIQIHYSACFNLGKWVEFADTLLNSKVIQDFDYFNYIPKPQREPNYCRMCAAEIKNISQLCRYCNNKRSRPELEKINWPTDAELHKLVWERPSWILCKELGVSDVAIKARCRKRGIPKPGRGYWSSLKSQENLA